MTLSYRTYHVTYEHSTETSDNIRQNQATVIVYGGGELRLRSEIERQRPAHKNISILRICESPSR